MTATLWLLAGLLVFGVVTDAVREPWAAAILHGGLLALAGVRAAVLAFRPQGAARAFPLLPLAAAALCAPIQLAAGLTENPHQTAAAAVFWLANLAAFFLGLQVSADADRRRAFRNALLYFAFAVSLAAAAQCFSSNGKVFWIFPTRYADQVMGPFVSRDHFASFVLLLLPAALYRALTDRRRMPLYAAMAAAMFAAVIAGASRAGAILATVEAAALLAPAVVAGRGREGSIGLLVRVAVFTTAFTLVVGWEAVWERFQQPDPYHFRREMLGSSLAMIRDRPWTGWGLGAWPNVYPEFALLDEGVFVNHAHNDWAEWAAEGGALFAVALAAIFLWSLRKAFEVPWGAGVAAVLCHSLVDYPMQKPSIAALLFAMLGALAAAAGSHRRRRTASCSSCGAPRGSAAAASKSHEDEAKNPSGSWATRRAEARRQPKRAAPLPRSRPVRGFHQLRWASGP